MEQQRSIIGGHLSAFFTVLIWGTTFIATKFLLVDFKPTELLFFRFILGYLALLLIHPRFLKTKGFREEALFMGAGLCGVTLYFLMENFALTLTLASNIGVIVSIAPFFTAVLAHFFLKGERLHSRFFIGFALAIAGILFIGWNGSFVLKLNPLGDILAVLASAAWAVYSILMRKISGLGYHTIGCTRKVFLYGFLFMIPAFFLSDFHLGLERFTNGFHILNILYLGLGASALCFVTWNGAVKILGAVKTSVYIYLIPVITIISSFFILRENITTTALVGALLTILGLILSEWKGKTIKTASNKAEETKTA